MDYELLKMGQGVLMVSSKKKLLWNLLEWADKTHTKSQTVYRWDSYPPEYEALIYTNIQSGARKTGPASHRPTWA